MSISFSLLQTSLYSIFPLRHGIMAKTEYPGVANVVSRLIWVQETGRSSRPTRTKKPLKSVISEVFSYSLSIAAQDLSINNPF